MNNNMEYNEKGFELFMKISENINKESFEKSKRVEKIFSMKQPIITYTFMSVCIFLFLFLVFFLGNNFMEISAALPDGRPIPVTCFISTPDCWNGRPTCPRKTAAAA